MGPLRVKEATDSSGNVISYTLQRNPYTWTRKYNMIFLDQPGTSFAAASSCC